MAIPVQTILKAVLFIGLLLLCIGIYYYKFDTRKEGFQAGWSESMCTSDSATPENKCNAKCEDKTINISLVISISFLLEAAYLL